MINFGADLDKGHPSPGACAVPQLIELCLIWLNNKSFKTYNSFEALAVDYGKNGTIKFFPLSLMAEMLSADERFNKFIKLESYNG